MKTYDAVVIGAGVAGLSAARELARRKQRVLLIEREDPGGVTSRAAAGMLDPYSETDSESPLLKCKIEAFKFYPQFLKEIKSAAPGDLEYAKLGLLYLALSEEDTKLLTERFKWQVRYGIPVKFYSSDEVQKLEPAVSRETKGGVFYPEISKLNAQKLVQAMLKAAESVGVRIQTSVRAAQVWVENGKIQGVKLGGERIESPTVVNAAGAWAGLVNNEILHSGPPGGPSLRMRGREKHPDPSVKVSPVRGQILLLKSTSALYPKRMFHSTSFTYVIPWPNQRLLIGTTAEKEESENRVTPEGREDILKRTEQMMPGIRQLPIESSWSGLRPFAGEGNPLVGSTSISGLYLAAGYYRSGILLGPYLGKLLAEGILAGKFSPLLKPFFPNLSN